MTTHPISASSVGIGLRGEHYRAATSTPHSIDWFEVHSENYFGRGGVPHEYLTKVRNDYPLSFHGVGLSIGSTDPLRLDHLTRLKELTEQYEPSLVSEHLSWSSIEGTHFHDLLPLPFNEEAVNHLVGRIQQVQEFLQRQILVENASTYLEFTNSTMSEWEFITEIAKRAGCKLLLDVNNVFVNACNHEFDALDFLLGVPENLVGEIHLSGHTVKDLPEGQIRIDTHDQRVCNEVWQLYEIAIQRFKKAPTLIEWDKDLPPFSTLLDEVATARSYQRRRRNAAA